MSEEASESTAGTLGPLPLEANPAVGDAADLAGEILTGDDVVDRRVPRSEEVRTVLPDDLLPGVGGATMSLRDAMRMGGVATMLTLGAAGFVQALDQAGFAILSPNIQKAFHVSDSVIAVIGSAFGVLFVLGALPISSLADRYPRKYVASGALVVWSVIMMCTGLVQNAFSLFVARMGAGLGESYATPVNGPLLVDSYPIQARGRVFAVAMGMGLVGQLLAPTVVGGIAAPFAPSTGWRWVFLIVGLLALPVALGMSRLHEPKRGQYEIEAVMGKDVEIDTLPVSLTMAFARLRKIRSFYFFLLGMAALGFALFTLPVFLNLIYSHVFHLTVWQRGLVGSITLIPGVVAIGIIGRRTDQLFRKSPPRSFVFMGGLIVLFGVLIAVAMTMPDLALFVVCIAIGTSLATCGFAILPAALSTVLPYRLRSRGFAMIGIYIFLCGSFFGAIITGLLAQRIGERPAVAVVVLIASTVGGSLMAYGGRYVRGDISLVVEELREEQEEAARMKSSDAVPLLQVHNLDFSYGHVQVLFDVNFEVARGEVLALLGTNGAGKSTLLRVISGLGVPERGVIRLNGRTVTYADPELRVRIGLVQLMGGGAVFAPLSVEENLKMACFLEESRDVAGKIDRVCELFPVLSSKRRSRAADLSGGEQQMLGLAMALVHDPELLIIDELSLGLAPIVVEMLLEVVAELKRRGMTLIIVEQSINIALALADRALFMEKGQIRFSGQAEDLLARDDLVRAVFLGTERP